MECENLNKNLIDRKVLVFLKRCLLFLYTIILISIYVSILIRNEEVKTNSKVFITSEQNRRLMENYEKFKNEKESKAEFTKVLGLGFSRIVYIDSQGKEVLNLSDQSKSLYFDVIERDITFLESSNKISKIKFYYSPFIYVEKVLTFWILLFALNIPLYLILISKLRKYYKEKLEEKALISIGELSRKVAHDIRSPLSSLKVISSRGEIKNLNEKRLLDAAISSIESIAEDILHSYSAKAIQSSFTMNRKIEAFAFVNNEPLIDFNPVHVIDKVCELKKLEVTQLGKIQLCTCISDQCAKTRVKGKPSELERILFNVLNNAIESIETSGSVYVDSNIENNEFILEVRDNGKGIPEDILNKLGNEEITYNKSKGNGMGLLSAKKTLQAWKGTIKFFSTLNKGTTVRIVLPIGLQML